MNVPQTLFLEPYFTIKWSYVRMNVAPFCVMEIANQSEICKGYRVSVQ